MHVRISHFESRKCPHCTIRVEGNLTGITSIQTHPFKIAVILHKFNVLFWRGTEDVSPEKAITNVFVGVNACPSSGGMKARGYSLRHHFSGPCSCLYRIGTE